jgi:gliding motility-associated-like protein
MKSTSKILGAFLLCISCQAHAQITSTFDTDADGWTALNANGGEPIYVSTGGNPDGYIRASDGVGGVPTLMVAPSKFLGNRIFSYGQLLHFDLKVALIPTSSGAGDIRIYGGGTSLFRNVIAPIPNTTTWTSYSLQLHEDQIWRVGSIGGPVATKEQMKQVLTSVTAIHISVEYNATIQNSTDIGYLDNVILEQRTLLPAPIIDSFTPASGPVGTTVTIHGTNFNTTPADNIVYFGGIQASVTSASATQLTVTTPDGVKIGPLTIISVTSGLQAQSPTSFTPIFADGGRIIPASLASRVDIDLDATFTSQSYLRGLTAADLDEDGWNDLITFQGDLGGGAGVVIYRNLQVQNDISVNSFSAPIELPLLPGVSGTTYDIESAKDLDGDGKLDLAFMYRQSSPNDGFFVTYRNISTPGNIAFEPVELFSSFNSTNEFTLRMADIDGDGRPDFMGTNQSNTHFFIAQNISTPGNIDFGAAIAYAVADLGTNNVSYSAASFLNSDTKTDVVLSIDGSTQLMILGNTSVPGALSFAPGVTIDLTNEISQPIIADINDDGKNDIIWRKIGISEIGIRLNSNTGGALSAVDFATEIVLTAELLNTEGFITVGDINGDGKKDIICTDNFDMLIFENVHAGGGYTSSSFVEAYNWRATGTGSPDPAYPMAVDLDGDQKPEVITGISGSASNPNKFISIFKNINTHGPVIAINTVSPLKGVVGSSVTITGDYFSTVPSENLVRFGSMKAAVTSATRTQLTVTVPTGATTELVSVTRDALTSTYRLPFVPTFSPGVVFNNTHFAPPVNFTATSAGINIGVSDLNSDGKPDVMVNNTTGSAGYAFRNTHVSGVISLTSLMADDTTGGFTHLIDFDGDGLEETMDGGTVHRNVSVGSEINFAFTTSVLGGGTNRSFGDFNADGKMDLAGINGATILFAENETQPGFQSTSSTTRIFKDNISLAKPGSGGGSASADFDGDGLTDVAATNPTLDNVSVFRNTGAYRITPIQFTAIPEIAVGDNPYRIYASDLDVDGKVDLLVIHQTTTTSQFVTVLHNQSIVGNISFARFDYPFGAFATEAHISDLDGDGKPEILVTSLSTDQFFIIKNTTTPGVMNASSFGIPFSVALNNPRGITTGDLNLDGKPEIIVSAGSVLAVYENLIPSVFINITTQPSPSEVCEGATTAFTTAASGTTNITYQWQFSTTLAGTYNDIANGGGFSNVSTASLSVNTSGNFGAGFYRCKVDGDLASTVFSNAVELTVNVVPLVPTIGTTNLGCAPASTTLNPTGASAGEEYKFYDVATGGSPINSGPSFTTPSLTVSTTYHISTYNTSTLCESTRVPAVVNVQTCNPPVFDATTATAFIEGIVTIDLEELISDLDNNLDPSTLQILSQPASGAPASLNGFIMTIDYSGLPFPGTDNVEIEICDLTGICTQQELTIELEGEIEIFNAVSPNNDGSNDQFFIQYIELFPDTENNHVTIYNRWGDVVFEISDYNNTDRVFKGQSDNGKDLPSGTYFYKLEFKSGRPLKTGYLSLKR